MTLPASARSAGHPGRHAARLAIVGTPPRMVVAGWNGPGGQLQLRVSPPQKTSLRRAVLMRAAADERLRSPAKAVFRRLPPSARAHLRRTLRPDV